MSAERRNRDKAMAAFLKSKGITRNSGACPMGCGRPITNGGGALAAHVGNCRGNPRKRPEREVSPGRAFKPPPIPARAVWDEAERREAGVPEAEHDLLYGGRGHVLYGGRD